MPVRKNNLTAVAFFMFVGAVFFFTGAAIASATVVIDGPFGEVPVGSTSTSAIQVNAPAAGSLVLTGMAFASGSSSQFSTSTSLPETGITLTAGTSTVIDVAFAPMAAGPASATLVISTITKSGWSSVPGEIHLNLTGTGIDTQAEQADAAGVRGVQSLLGFFDGAVAAGQLEGKGKGKSAAGRLNALRNMIKSVEKTLQAGQKNMACQRLGAVSRAVGANAQGDAAGELAAMVVKLKNDLGCN